MDVNWVFFGLIAMAIALTFFSFRTTSFVFRASSASSWLTILLFVMASDRSMLITNPWVVAFIVTIFAAMAGALLLYLGKEISQQGIVIGKMKDKRPPRQKRQEDYKALLQSKTRRYPKL